MLRGAVIVGVVAALVFANALGNAYALDDNVVILANPLVHRAAGVWLAFGHSYWPEASGAGQYRPITVASFALDWAVSSGAFMWFHLVNVAWHVVVCLLVWRLLREWVSPTAAVVGGLVFAVHPVHVEAVANLVGRSELLCAAFTLGALLVHRRRSWVAIPLYAAALCSKESGIVFVGLAAASDLLLPAGDVCVTRPAVQPTDGPPPGSIPSTATGGAASASLGLFSQMPWLRRRARRKQLYIGYACVTAAYGGLLALLFRDQPLLRTAVIWQHAGPIVRWLTVVRVIPEYARLLLFPLRLHVDYGPRLIDLVDRPTPAVLIGVLIGLAAIIAVVRFARTTPLLAFAFSLFAITILPVANVVFPTGIILAERTLYLPSVGLALVVAWGVDRWRLAEWHNGPRRFAVPAVAGLVLIALGVRTWTRTPIWKNNKTVMIASLVGEPMSYRAHERAADVLDRAGDVAGALREYTVARSLYPVDPMLYQAPATLLVGRGDSGDAAAAVLLDSALVIDPSPYQDALRRAWVRYAAHDYLGAIDWSRSAYLKERDSVNAVMVLTQAAQQINDATDADAAFRMALADHPHDRALHRSYAALLRSTGDTAMARREEDP